MTDHEAFHKYFLQFKADPESGVLLELDEQMNIIKHEIIYDTDTLGIKRDALDLADKNFAQIYDFNGLKSYFLVGNSEWIEMNVETGRIEEFDTRRKGPIDLKQVAKELQQLQSGTIIMDEELTKYSS